MPIYSYTCPQGHLTEQMTKYETRTTSLKCICGLESEYIISAPKIDYYHMGIDARGNPTAGRKWADMHLQKAMRDNENPVD